MREHPALCFGCLAFLWSHCSVPLFACRTEADLQERGGVAKAMERWRLQMLAVINVVDQARRDRAAAHGPPRVKEEAKGGVKRKAAEPKTPLPAPVAKPEPGAPTIPVPCVTASTPGHHDHPQSPATGSPMAWPAQQSAVFAPVSDDDCAPLRYYDWRIPVSKAWAHLVRGDIPAGSRVLEAVITVSCPEGPWELVTWAGQFTDRTTELRAPPNSTFICKLALPREVVTCDILCLLR